VHLGNGETHAVTEKDFPGWLTVDADIQGNHVLAFYDYSLQDERIPLDSCWLDATLSGQCRQRETDGSIMVLAVSGSG
jgi:hypothetical protein